MTTYYVGKGGSDSNNGTTWALRKLTIADAEDIGLSANDEVVVGPGVYREQIILTDAGTAGNHIVWRGDPTGRETDGIGGRVVITGSDNDQTSTRSWGFTTQSTAMDYHKFTHFHFEMHSAASIHGGMDNRGAGWIIEDCTFLMNGHVATGGIVLYDVDGDYEIRRCLFLSTRSAKAITINISDVTSINSTIDNCVLIGGGGIFLQRAQDVAIKNCTFLGIQIDSIKSNVALTGTVTVNNCIFAFCLDGIDAYEVGDVIEDYNNFWSNNTDRRNTDTGTNSETYPPMFELPLLIDGFEIPSSLIGSLSGRTPLVLAGSSEVAHDVFGITKPTAAKSSWGAIQQRLVERETTTKRTGDASLKKADAGDFVYRIPVDGSEITVACYVYREANYAGTLPRMIIKEPGQSDQVTTDTGSASQWNQLTDTFTPQSETNFIEVILRSLNTATSGSYDVFFDDFGVT